MCAAVCGLLYSGCFQLNCFSLPAGSVSADSSIFRRISNIDSGSLIGMLIISRLARAAPILRLPDIVKLLQFFKKLII